MRDYMKLVESLLENEKKTKVKDQTVAPEIDLDDGSSKGDLAAPNAETPVDEPRVRDQLPGRRAGRNPEFNPAPVDDEQSQRALNYLDHLRNHPVFGDDAEDDHAVAVDGEPEHDLLPAPETTEPVTPETLPTVINQALMSTDRHDVVREPEWHMVENLPNYQLKAGIRRLGRVLFNDFTDTPIDEIQVLASMINPNDVHVMAEWIRRHGVPDDTNVNIDFGQIMPGYRADVSLWSAEGCQFMLVRDFLGEYIYGWPGGRGTRIGGRDEPTGYLEGEENEEDALEEGMKSFAKKVGVGAALAAAGAGLNGLAADTKQKDPVAISTDVNGHMQDEKESYPMVPTHMDNRGFPMKMRDRLIATKNEGVEEMSDEDAEALEEARKLARLAGIQEESCPTDCDDEDAIAEAAMFAALAGIKPTTNEAKSRVVPSSMLGDLGRWDAGHVIDVADETEARGADISDGETVRQVSRDIRWADAPKQGRRIKHGPGPEAGTPKQARTMTVDRPKRK